MPRHELRKDDAGYGQPEPGEIVALDRSKKVFVDDKCRLCGGERETQFWLCNECMPKRTGRTQFMDQALCDVCPYFMWCSQKVKLRLPVLCEGLDVFTLEYAEKHDLDVHFADPPQSFSHQNNIKNSSHSNVSVDNRV